MAASFWLMAARRLPDGAGAFWMYAGSAICIVGSAVLPHATWRAAGALAVLMPAMPAVTALLFMATVLAGRKHAMAIDREISAMLDRAGGNGPYAGHGLLLVMPVHNEEHNLPRVLDALGREGVFGIADVLCVVNASSDRSADIARNGGCLAMESGMRIGYGGALLAGYRYACRHKYRYVVQMDADGQHDACNVRAIYDALRKEGGPDMVLGSRYLPGSSAFKVSMAKNTAFWLYRHLIRFFTGRRVSDATTGLQGLSAEAVGYYAAGRFDVRYPDANMLEQMILAGFSMGEIPAVMHSRTYGKSMHSGLCPVFYMLRMPVSMLVVWARHAAGIDAR